MDPRSFVFCACDADNPLLFKRVRERDYDAEVDALAVQYSNQQDEAGIPTGLYTPEGSETGDQVSRKGAAIAGHMTSVQLSPPALRPIYITPPPLSALTYEALEQIDKQLQGLSGVEATGCRVPDSGRRKRRLHEAFEDDLELPDMKSRRKAPELEARSYKIPKSMKKKRKLNEAFEDELYMPDIKSRTLRSRASKYTNFFELDRQSNFNIASRGEIPQWYFDQISGKSEPWEQMSFMEQRPEEEEMSFREQRPAEDLWPYDSNADRSWSEEYVDDMVCQGTTEEAFGINDPGGYAATSKNVSGERSHAQNPDSTEFQQSSAAEIALSSVGGGKALRKVMKTKGKTTRTLDITKTSSGVKKKKAIAGKHTNVGSKRGR